MILQAIALGVVQGVTEFLPISSTAHLIVLQSLFQLDQSQYGLSLDMFTNLGTLLATLLYFRKDITQLTKQPQHLKRLLLASLPVLLVGFALRQHIASDFRSLPVIMYSLVAVGILMLLAEYMPKKIRVSAAAAVWLVGASQCLALIPGVSRSGITMVTGLFAGMQRSEAAKLSFLLSLPVTLVATVFQTSQFAVSVAGGRISSSTLSFYLLSGITAFITGYAVIAWLLRFYSQHTLTPFALYRLVLAIFLATLFI
jgi:undecaprenyl-diphosphatase